MFTGFNDTVFDGDLNSSHCERVGTLEPVLVGVVSRWRQQIQITLWRNLSPQ